MLTQRSSRQRGFTLIELVVVIVIIGILAAFAIPRFAGLATDARTSAVQGMLGTARSSSALVHGLALARNQNGATGNVPLEGVAGGVNTVYGYPAGDANGIAKAIGNAESYTPDYSTAGTVVFSVNGATTPATCSVTYTEAPSGGVPTITPAVGGC